VEEIVKLWWLVCSKRIFPPKISSPAPPLNNPIIIYTMTI
jgi:hypothetical protein